MADVLSRIAEYKREEVEALKAATTEAELMSSAQARNAPRGFRQALETGSVSAPAIIAEVKKASPSKGIIREDFDPVAIAKSYQSGGATCLSVLTDAPSFKGSNAIFEDVRVNVGLPMLRKDFMVDTIQVIESRALGADCILVILAMIDDALARDLIDTAQDLGMDALIETHDQSEVERALSLDATLIGINNRNLKTFETALDTFGPLARLVPDDTTLVAESGIFTFDDIERLTGEGAQAFLIGESLMRQKDVEQAVRELTGA